MDSETDTDPHGWSGAAEGWATLWGGFAEPAWRRLAELTAIGAGSRVLDVGCGSGELLAYVAELGASPAGVDPDLGMARIARSRVPDADVRVAPAERLPWPDGTFDVVTAINALQFADDVDDALAELVRVTAPGGLVGVANWAESERSDLKAIDAAVAAAAGTGGWQPAELAEPAGWVSGAPSPEGDLRKPGGLEAFLGDGGLTVVTAGIVGVLWEAPDDGTLVRGVLLGEDEDAMTKAAPRVLDAAQQFRTPAGGYRFVNTFRYAVGRKTNRTTIAERHQPDRERH